MHILGLCTILFWCAKENTMNVFLAINIFLLSNFWKLFVIRNTWKVKVEHITVALINSQMKVNTLNIFGIKRVEKFTKCLDTKVLNCKTLPWGKDFAFTQEVAYPCFKWKQKSSAIMLDLTYLKTWKMYAKSQVAYNSNSVIYWHLDLKNESVMD